MKCAFFIPYIVCVEIINPPYIVKEKLMSEENTPAAISGTYLPVLPQRTLVSAEEAQKRASRCSENNDSRHEICNFSNLEFNKITFKGEDLSGSRAHYSKFTDCDFLECNFENMEFIYTVFENCRFTNCRLERGDFSFAILDNVSFTSCNLNGSDFPYARGSVTLKNCLMTRCTAFYSALKLALTDTNAVAFKANVANVELDVLRSSFRNGEFNDSTVRGVVSETDLVNSEFNRADMSQLKIINCPRSNMESEEAAEYEEIPDIDLIDIFDRELDSDSGFDPESEE